MAETLQVLIWSAARAGGALLHATVRAVQEELKKQQRRERFNLPPTPEEQAKMDAAAKAATAKEIADKKQVMQLWCCHTHGDCCM